MQVNPPADEDASNLQIKAARAHAVLYRQQLQDHFDYANKYAQTLQEAIDKTRTRDQTASDAARRAGERRP